MTARIRGLRWLVLIGWGLLILRLGYLQLGRGDFYRRLAEGNRIRLVPEQAPRGLLLDRHGRILAANQPIFRVALIPQEVRDLEETLTALSSLAQVPVEQLQRRWDRERGQPFVPATLLPAVAKETALRLEEDRWRWPGVIVKAETIRAYPFGRVAAHLLGYLSQPTAEELSGLKRYGIGPRELIGRSGLEAVFDGALRGTPGGTLVEVDSRGRLARVLGRRDPLMGKPVVLTLDAQLQSLIEAAFGEQRGAAVVLDPRTGEVLAMASIPGFRPEAFVTHADREVRGVLQDSASPLMNRATEGTYQPGSTAKLIVAAAALEAGVITPDTTIHCPGAIAIGDRRFHCWNRDGHGPMRLTDAILQSCNVYFMQVGRRLGLEPMRGAMRAAGFAERTGWLLHEQPGHVPQRPLTEGEVAILALGQSELLVTPLQVAVMVSAYANGGRILEPWIVRAVGDRHVGGRRVRRILPWSEATFKAVREGMRAVVHDPAGTGHRAASPHITIAAKTGTAQTHIPDAPHGWFVGFCPIDQPEVVMAILAEHGGSGGDLPSEIGRTVCEYVAAMNEPAADSVGPHGQSPWLSTASSLDAAFGLARDDPGQRPMAARSTPLRVAVPSGSRWTARGRGPRRRVAAGRGQQAASEI